MEVLQSAAFGQPAVQEVRDASAKADNQNAVALLAQRRQGSFLVAMAKESFCYNSPPQRYCKKSPTASKSLPVRVDTPVLP